MRVLVTGAAGFLGSHVCEVLLQNGCSVLGIDDLSGGTLENVPKSIEFVKASITDDLNPIFQQFKPASVYHLAAYAAEGLSHHIPVFNYMNNTVGTANILAACYRHGVKHFVFTSSIAVYGHPATDEPFTEATVPHPCDPYGAAKLACEHHIRSVFAYFGGPAFTIFRPHNVFGSRQNISDPYRNVVGIFMGKALQGLPFPIFGDGTQTRSFSHVHSVASAIAAAPFLQKARNATFNIGGDEPMSVKGLADLVSNEFCIPLKIDYLSPRKEVAHAHCDHSLAKNVFPEAYARALDIRSGLTEMAQYVRQRPIPNSTECPTQIEIVDQLPPSWLSRLRGSD